MIQVLVLQHDDAPPTEWMPYLRALFSPVPVIEFWGQAARRVPPCLPDLCVWHWWKERRKPIFEVDDRNLEHN